MVKKRIPQKIEERIKEYIDILRNDDLPIKKVVLFGSYAKGSQHKWSDVDIAIVSPKFTNHFEALHYLNHKTKNREPYYLEPHGLTPDDFKDKYNSLAQEIEKHGIELNI